MRKKLPFREYIPEDKVQKVLRYVSHKMNIIEPNGIADYEWATRLNRVVLNLLGIWPTAYKNACDKFLSDLYTVFVFVVIVLFGFVPFIHSLVKTWGDLMSMIDNLQFTVPLTISLVKLVLIWWKKTDILIVINMIADDWIKVKTEKERCIMIKQAQNARVIAITGYSIMFLGITLTVIFPYFGTSVLQTYRANITNSDRILPIQTQYNYDKQSPYFEFTYVAQIYMSLMCGGIYTSVDQFLGLLIFHLCGQLENLKEKLINIRQFDSYKKDVAFVVEEHIRLIKCFQIIEKTFTFLLLGLLIYFGIIFCFYGFIILTNLTGGTTMSISRLMYIICNAINLGGHMCLFCAIGEILITKCEAIYYAACEYEWYELDQQKAKTLLLILIRANKPLYITAGKMFPMTMSMFCDLIKTSAGYISVLLAMQNKKN